MQVVGPRQIVERLQAEQFEESRRCAVGRFGPACVGGADAFVPAADIIGFRDEMEKAGVDYAVNVYGGAHHSFTNPDADRHKIENIQYNKEADEQSWEAMKQFFSDVFK